MLNLKGNFKLNLKSSKYAIPLFLFLSFLFLLPISSNAQKERIDAGYLAPFSPDSLLLQVSFRNALNTGVLNGVEFVDLEAMREFYGKNSDSPFWLSDKSNPVLLDHVISILENSWKHGLNPNNYHLEEIRTLTKSPMQKKKARLELLISDAIVRYGVDLSGMRVNPDMIKQKPEYWRQSKTGQEILNDILTSNDPVSVIKTLEPKGKLYKALQNELVYLKSNQQNYDHLLPINFNSTFLKLGDYDKSMPKLRARLGLVHDPAYGSENKYDDPLSAAVMKFQSEHGIEPDGIIGPKTLKLINNSREDRIKQVIANLERLRWLEQDRPDRYVVANIPSATVWGVENSQVKFEMPVVVGMSYRPTMSFKATITGVRFNPKWTIPHSIKWKDILPKVQNDISYLNDKGISLYYGYGKDAEEVDARDIDWDTMTWSKIGKIRMVQSSGDHNALGRIRVLMQNPYNIYMHDTNHKELFDRSERNLSSGCIRLSDPKEMAHFILNVNDDWNESKLHEYLSDTKTRDISAKVSIPVYILYQTMWLNEKGQLVYGHDIYNRDTKLINALEEIDGVYIPPLPSSLYASSSSNEG
jgi:murein L,D-transpeptidase YcbB/YkuD